MQVYEFNVPTFGKGVVFDVDHKVRHDDPSPTHPPKAAGYVLNPHSLALINACTALQVRGEQFRFFAEALKSAKLKVYVPYFVQEAQASITHSDNLKLT